MVDTSLPFVKWKDKAFVIGLTGGIASGKSTAAEIFRKAGIRVINADMLAKDVFERKEIQMRLVKHFGDGILDDNTVSRKKVAEKVFNNSENLKFLNSLIHPEVKKAFNDIKMKLGDNEIVVYDVPLLFETNRDDEYDITLAISAPIEVRLKRATERSGWTEEEFLIRDKAQIPMREKENRADVVIHNTGSFAELEIKVLNFIEHIKKSRHTN
jgi:dephospho-CoA kinase